MRGVEMDEKKTLIVSARSHLEAALKANPKNAEAHALLSSILGSEIGLAPIRAMVLGPQSSMERDTSLRLEPANPRVLLLAGTNLLHTPEMYGGAAEPAQRPWPNWGRYDAHVWLGQVLEKNDKRDAARAEYEEALKLAPQSGYVRAILLPRVTPKS
jgi:tetratricopeptide (TPR) repeat protein